MEKKEAVVKTEKQLSDKERALLILKGMIAHFRHLEKALMLDETKIAKKVGALRFVSGLIEKM
jgi:hypothetical protein